MFEFLFGFFVGVWAGQALPLPSVGVYLQSYFASKVEVSSIQEKEEENEDHVPLFTGNIPTQVPSV